MKMKEREVKGRLENLLNVSGLILPSKLSFAMSYNMEKLQKEYTRLDKEREKLCKQYADKDKSGEPVMVKSSENGKTVQSYKMSAENEALFKKEYEDLLDTEVDIEIRTVKMEIIERCEEAERYSIPTAAQIYAMSFMLED